MDGRKQGQNKKKAIKLLKQKVDDYYRTIKQEDKNTKRIHKLHNTKTIRTYDFKSGIVKNHLTGKKASLREVLFKGRIDLINERNV